MSKIKCAIIGMGVGEKHLEAIKKSKIAEIVAICDFKESKIKCKEQNLSRYWMFYRRFYRGSIK